MAHPSSFEPSSKRCVLLLPFHYANLISIHLQLLQPDASMRPMFPAITQLPFLQAVWVPLLIPCLAVDHTTDDV